MYRLKKCALCGEEKEIQLSHIIPKFVGRHLKKTSVGNIRNMEDPNKTVQDLEKYYLICHDCEELFSASERRVANNNFYQWKKNEKDEFEYNSYLHFYYLNPHVTIHRATTSYTHYSDDTIFTISNLMGIITITLYQIGKQEAWKGTKIEVTNGKIIAANQSITSVVGAEFQYWLKQSQENQEKMSETQKQKIVQRMKDIGEDIVNYDIYQDYLDDRNLDK